LITSSVVRGLATPEKAAQAIELPGKYQEREKNMSSPGSDMTAALNPTVSRNLPRLTLLKGLAVVAAPGGSGSSARLLPDNTQNSPVLKHER
jgi:uncharacterized protein YbbK (DUF523 family)